MGKEVREVIWVCKGVVFKSPGLAKGFGDKPIEGSQNWEFELAVLFNLEGQVGYMMVELDTT